MNDDRILAEAFGSEWAKLDRARRRVILRDYRDACADDSDPEFDADEYRRRIGAGNLRAYGDVMMSRERRGWHR